MKTINMLADTIQMILGGVQEFAAAFFAIGGMTKDAMEAAQATLALEFQKAIKAAK